VEATRYLVGRLLFKEDEPALNVVYDFVFDRLRAVRQEGKSRQHPCELKSS
jgi:hypothetical protein